MEKILSKLIIRHRKIDSQVIQEVQLPEHEEEVMWINFTELERKLYDSKVRSMTSYTRHPSNNSIELQQLCCHILVSNNNNRKFGSLNEIDLDQMQDELRGNAFKYHKYLYEKIRKVGFIVTSISYVEKSIYWKNIRIKIYDNNFRQFNQ